MKVKQIREKILSYPISALSKRYKFNQRSDAKITLANFIGGFFLSQVQSHSLKCWTCSINAFLSSGVKVSKAGLQKRLGLRQLAAVKGFLETVLDGRLQELHQSSVSQGWFSDFGQVFLEDSVCVKLNSSLFEFFPGPHSSQGKASTAPCSLAEIPMRSPNQPS